MSQDDKQKRTGRTGRMLEAAIEESRKSGYVMVFGENVSHAKQLQIRCGEMVKNSELAGTKVYAPGIQIAFESVNHTSFNWNSLRMASAFPGIPVFVDHWAIEHKFETALRELHRFD